jgi:hypothetical protein
LIVAPRPMPAAALVARRRYLVAVPMPKRGLTLDQEEAVLADFSVAAWR